jgi:hypothetical protein
MVPRVQRKRRQIGDGLIDLRQKFFLISTRIQQDSQRNRIVPLQTNMRGPKLRSAVEAYRKSVGGKQSCRLTVSAQHQHRNLNRIRINMQRRCRCILRCQRRRTQPTAKHSPQTLNPHHRPASRSITKVEIAGPRHLESMPEHTQQPPSSVSSNPTFKRSPRTHKTAHTCGSHKSGCPIFATVSSSLRWAFAQRTALR